MNRSGRWRSSCWRPRFLATAGLQLSGGELTPTDFSQFQRGSDGKWKLSHNVQVGQDEVATVRGMAASKATPTRQAVTEPVTAAIGAEIFARSTGGTTGNRELVLTSPTLDRQLAAGWEVYQQALAPAGMKVARTLTSSQWSDCSATTPDGTLTFLTVHATDTVTAVKGHDKVTLPAPSPDLVSTGHRGAATGTSIALDLTRRVHRGLQWMGTDPRDRAEPAGHDHDLEPGFDPVPGRLRCRVPKRGDVTRIGSPAGRGPGASRSRRW